MSWGGLDDRDLRGVLRSSNKLAAKSGVNHKVTGR